MSPDETASTVAFALPRGWFWALKICRSRSRRKKQTVRGSGRGRRAPVPHFRNLRLAAPQRRLSEFGSRDRIRTYIFPVNSRLLYLVELPWNTEEHLRADAPSVSRCFGGQRGLQLASTAFVKLRKAHWITAIDRPL